MTSRKVVFVAAMLLLASVVVAVALQVTTLQVTSQPPLAKSLNSLNSSGKFPKAPLHRLYVYPRAVFRTVKPGSDVEVKVTIKNVGNTTAIVKPRIVQSNYYFIMTGNMPMPESWVRISPKSVKLEPSEKTEIDLKLSVPNNTSNGNYFCLIALTNDTVNLPYSPYTPFTPKYLYTVSINLEVRKPPDVVVYPTYLSTTVLKGKNKTLKIYVKNSGRKCYSMNPVLESPEYFVSDYTKPLTKDMVSINAPKLIPPNSTVVVNVTLKGLEEGRFSGRIDLNINDTNLEDYNQKVYVTMTVVTPPKTAYVREINVSNLSELKVKVTVNDAGTYSEVRLISPDGKIVKPESVTESVYVSRVKPSFPVPIKPYAVYEKTAGYTASSEGKTYEFVVVKPENGVWKVSVKTISYANIEIKKIY